jgi:condensin complex subunit 2
VDFLDKLPHFLKKNEETSWQKASASLDASAKIYGYRVDSVHSETFKFLGGLSRAEKEEKLDGQDNENEDDKKRKNRENRHDGYTTLESNPKKLDLVKYDLEFEVDPLFKSMTVKFGDSGARGLLLKTLPLDKNIDVFLESKTDENMEIQNPLVDVVAKQDEKNGKSLITDKLEQAEIENPYIENCAVNPSDINSILNRTMSQFSVNDLKSLQLCPDLTYFKKQRELDNSLERTFFANLMNEFDDTLLRENLLDQDESPVESLNQSFNFENNENMDNFSSASQKSDYDSNISAKFDDMNINMNNYGNINQNLGVSYMEGFSYLKSDDIKEYIHQFGDGNKHVFKNMPQYKSFAKTFGQLEKFNSLNNNLNDEKREKKIKKEEIFFDFSAENEVLKGDIFEKESMAKKNQNIRDHPKRKNKKKVKQMFHYDRSILFNLFNIQERIINENQEQQKLSHEDENLVNNFNYENQDENLSQRPEELNQVQTFVKIDSDYEKKFGRLYKTFDVRLIKNKIWDSITMNTKKQLVPDSIGEGLEFKKIIESVYSNLTKEVINNISTPTCFVCLLHLSNEKSIKFFIIIRSYP